ncbi:hypothetical protein CMI41_04495 [Candidatus Pacearchaeota archaeon]|nr:hypothetical protein [Candidatus Pacearchaeota archaeon]|tara:strand:+ start:5256 stop:5564 length:309 start_codon:yes stop_codon:yes gene_type:complete
MSLKTHVHSRQVYKHRNKGTRRKIRSCLSLLAETEDFELVPTTNFSKLIFRDRKKDIYLLYESFGCYGIDHVETVAAAVPKAREGEVDLGQYAREFKAAHFS